MNDKDLDEMLRTAAKGADRSVPADLMARVLADAERLQPNVARAIPEQRQPWSRQLLDAIGGWAGPAAIAASLVLGIGLGAAGPEGLGLPLVSDPTSEAFDALGLGEFDLSSAEW